MWGDHGQASLETAHVCLINATGLGTEILKSLVLPGIGSFTIVDGKKISIEDIGSKYKKLLIHQNHILITSNFIQMTFHFSFFLDADSVGKSRAQIATQLLLELNTDVRGDYVDEEPEQILSNSPDFFNNFTIVVATSMTEK